jgi:hypothetical protein
MKRNWIRWAVGVWGCEQDVAHMGEMRISYRVLVGRPEVTTRLGKPKRILEIILQ